MSEVNEKKNSKEEVFYSTKNSFLFFYMSNTEIGGILLKKNLDKWITEKPEIYKITKVLKVVGDEVYYFDEFAKKEKKASIKVSENTGKMEELPPSVQETAKKKYYGEQ